MYVVSREVDESMAAKKKDAEVILQYGDKTVSYDEIVKRMKGVWKSELKRDAKDMKSMALYVKPEENRVYYVINDDEVIGSFEL